MIFVLHKYNIYIYTSILYVWSIYRINLKIEDQECLTLSTNHPSKKHFNLIKANYHCQSKNIHVQRILSRKRLLITAKDFCFCRLPPMERVDRLRWAQVPRQNRHISEKVMSQVLHSKLKNLQVSAVSRKYWLTGLYLLKLTWGCARKSLWKIQATSLVSVACHESHNSKNF